MDKRVTVAAKKKWYRNEKVLVPLIMGAGLLFLTIWAVIDPEKHAQDLYELLATWVGVAGLLLCMLWYRKSRFNGHMNGWHVFGIFAGLFGLAFLVNLWSDLFGTLLVKMIFGAGWVWIFISAQQWGIKYRNSLPGGEPEDQK